MSFFSGCFAPVPNSGAPLPNTGEEGPGEEATQKAQSPRHSPVLLGCLAPSAANEAPGNPTHEAGSPTQAAQLDRGSSGSFSSEGHAGFKQLKTHLVMLVHGLGGSHKDWAGFCKVTGHAPGLGHMLLRPSVVNGGRRSTEGIDVCGDRLVEEIVSIIGQEPSLRHISFIAHSLGGLFSRYAIGVLFDEASELVGGLTPKHFVTIASPHLGCDKDGDAQVPLLTWVGAIPMVGNAAGKAAKSVVGSVSDGLLGRSGKQLFLKDGDPEWNELPIVEALTLDVPGKAAFFSALSAFRSRTVYANSWGDVLVGWANSSLRFLHQLPSVKDLTPGKLHSHPAPQSPTTLPQVTQGTGQHLGRVAGTFTAVQVSVKKEVAEDGDDDREEEEEEKGSSTPPVEPASVRGENTTESEEGGSQDQSHGPLERQAGPGSCPHEHAVPESLPGSWQDAAGRIECTSTGASLGGIERREHATSTSSTCEQPCSQPSEIPTPLADPDRILADADSLPGGGSTLSEPTVATAGPRVDEPPPATEAEGSAAMLDRPHHRPFGGDDSHSEAHSRPPLSEGNAERASAPVAVLAEGQWVPAIGQEETLTTSRRRPRIKQYTNERTNGMLMQLQRLPWNRVDVTFKSGLHAFDSHNHIKAAKNKGITKHLITLLVDLEQGDLSRHDGDAITL